MFEPRFLQVFKGRIAENNVEIKKQQTATKGDAGNSETFSLIKVFVDEGMSKKMLDELSCTQQ